MTTEALRGITAQHVRVALLFGGIFWLVTMLVEWQFFVRFRGWRGAGIDLVGIELGALGLLLAVSIADAAIAHGAGRRTAYVVAALAGCVVSHVSLWTVGEKLNLAILGPMPTPLVADGFATVATMRIYAFTHWLLFAGTGVFLYAQWRSARRMQEHLRAAELDRVGKSRLALESRLQALQARVEPGFLFSTLSQVRELYDRDVALATNMLDDLIAYLRAAMPHMRDTSSTVAQEVELARAYLDIARLRLDGRLGVDVAVAEGTANARMPPMMLLPLIDSALATFGETDAMPMIRVGLRTHTARLQASVICTPCGSKSIDATALANIRERLSGLYGDNASLRIDQATARCVEARLDVPLEFGFDLSDEEAHPT